MKFMTTISRQDVTAPGVSGRPLPGAHPERLAQVDALRGIAALMVVGFHFSTRYDSLFVHVAESAIRLPWGFLGVYLFFIISGFVIHMTLERTRAPFDFVVSRFSRLFPAYWGAIALTVIVVAVLGLPGKSVGAQVAIANLTMVQGLLGFRHVDGVYWTLEVELLFYGAMLTLHVLGLLPRVRILLAAWILFAVALTLLDRNHHLVLPGTIHRLLILEYIPYFALGVVTWSLYRGPATLRADFATALLAVSAIAYLASVERALVVATFGGFVFLAARARLAPLSWRPLVWFGAISYPLYLVHENIGWALMLQLQHAGSTPEISMVCAFAAVVTVAYGVHSLIEQPAMAWLRCSYASCQARWVAPASATPRRWRWVAGIVVFFVGSAGVGVATGRAQRAVEPPGSEYVRGTVPTSGPAFPCRVERPPRVLLVLGQSNAANHGRAGGEGDRPIKVFGHGRCYLSQGSLPGATGDQAAIWPSLVQRLSADPNAPETVVALLAVESTAIASWVRPGPLRSRLDHLLQSLNDAGLKPDAVLWQQGESDARLGTSAEDYRAAFAELVQSLRRAGVAVPVLVARSTWCRGDGMGVIHRVQERLVDPDMGIYPGPDLDRLRGGYRYDDCHFSADGLRAATDAWVAALRAAVPVTRDSHAASTGKST